jgi:hypothetical protein
LLNPVLHVLEETEKDDLFRYRIVCHPDQVSFSSDLECYDFIAIQVEKAALRAICKDHWIAVNDFKRRSKQEYGDDYDDDEDDDSEGDEKEEDVDLCSDEVLPSNNDGACDAKQDMDLLSDEVLSSNHDNDNIKEEQQSSPLLLVEATNQNQEQREDEDELFTSQDTSIGYLPSVSTDFSDPSLACLTMSVSPYSYSSPFFFFEPSPSSSSSSLWGICMEDGSDGHGPTGMKQEDDTLAGLSFNLDDACMMMPPDDASRTRNEANNCFEIGGNLW